MAQVFAHPFRLAGNAVAKVEDGSDAGLAQQIAVLATTRRGERPMVPAFGVTDPVFSSLSLAELNAGLAMFGPRVSVTGVDVDPVDDRTVRTRVTYVSEGGAA
jgi:phage baseplate assembly protein W